MKSWLPSLVIPLLAIAAAALTRPMPEDPADQFAYSSVPQLSEANHPGILDGSKSLNSSKTCDSPLCECKSCECLTCSCTPLEVGPPPDGVQLVATEAAEVAEEKFTQPVPSVDPILPPDPIPSVTPLPKPKPKAAAPAGHWQTVYAGIRGRRSYQVWVPAAGSVSAPQQRSSCSSCSNGSCSPQRFGSVSGGPG